jgi:hypothetical protein
VRRPSGPRRRSRHHRQPVAERATGISRSSELLDTIGLRRRRISGVSGCSTQSSTASAHRMLHSGDSALRRPDLATQPTELRAWTGCAASADLDAVRRRGETMRIFTCPGGAGSDPANTWLRPPEVWFGLLARASRPRGTLASMRQLAQQAWKRPCMGRHRRQPRAPYPVSELAEHELIAISVELQRRLPSTLSDRVDAAIRDAVDALSGLDTAPQHVSALVSRRAETTLDWSLHSLLGIHIDTATRRSAVITRSTSFDKPLNQTPVASERAAQDRWQSDRRAAPAWRPT